MFLAASVIQVACRANYSPRMRRSSSVGTIVIYCNLVPSTHYHRTLAWRSHNLLGARTNTAVQKDRRGEMGGVGSPGGVERTGEFSTAGL